MRRQRKKENVMVDPSKVYSKWICAIKAAQPRVPINEDEDQYLKKLIVKPAMVISLMWQRHVSELFLGPDKQESLKDNVKNIKQGPRVEIPAYNCRVCKAAKIAYPEANPSEDS